MVLRRALPLVLATALAAAAAAAEGWVARFDFDGCEPADCLAGWEEQALVRPGVALAERHFVVLDDPLVAGNRVVGSTLDDGDAVNPGGGDHPAPRSGRLLVRNDLVLRGGVYRLRARVLREEQGLLGVALVRDDGAQWLLGGTTPVGTAGLSIGSGSWTSARRDGDGAAAPGIWHDLLVEFDDDGQRAILAIWLWPSGEAKPVAPAATVELHGAGLSSWHPALWATGSGRKLFDDVVLEYLGPLTDRALELEILESGSPLPDGASYNRAVRPIAVVRGGWGPVTLSLTLDQKPWQSGLTVSDEGRHSIAVSASSSPPLRVRLQPPRPATGTVRAQAARAFTIDRTPPRFLALQPAAGSFVNGTPVVLSGTLSEAVARVTAGDAAAAVRERSFTAAVPLLEGANPLSLQAVDLAGNVGAVVHLVTLDTRPPLVTVSAPSAGAWVNTPTTGVTGSVDDANLLRVTVSGVTASVTGTAWRADVGLAEGGNALAVVAEDRAGNATRVTHAVNLDTVPPVIELLESGTTFAGPLALGRPAVLDARVADASPVTVSARLDGASFTLGTPVSAEGQHLFEVTATDAAGNAASVSASVTVDSGGPALEIASPVSGALFGATTVEVRGSCGDAVRVTVNGVAGSLAGGQFAASVPLEAEGDNVLLAEAVDAAGSSSRASVTVARDTLPPQIVLASPAADAVTRFATARVEGTASDPHLATVSVNGAVATLAGGGFGADVVLVEGANPVTVVAADVLGHVATLERRVTRDSVAPVVRVLDGGVEVPEGRVFNRVVRPTVAVEDATAVTTEVTLNGEAFAAGGEVAAEGRFLLRAVATDAAGNVTRLERTFRVDRTPPVLSALEPAGGTVVGASPVDLAGNCDDAVTVTVAGRAATVAGGRFSLVGLALAEGAAALPVEAADEAGNRATLEWRLTLDRQAPVVTISAPADGALVGQATVTVQGTVSDASAVSVTVQGVAATLAGTGFVAASVPLEEGRHPLVVEATDRAGHRGSATVTIERDTTPPVVTITSPATGSRLALARATVRGTAADAHLQSVRVNGVAAATSGDTFEATLTLPEGDGTIAVEAQDAAGNVGRATAVVAVDPRAPQVAITSPQESALLRAQPVTVLGTVAESDLASLTVNGTEAAVVAGRFTAEGIPLLEGSNDLTARATDRAGNEGVHVVRVTFDATPPRLVSSDPGDGAARVPRAAPLRLTFSEPLAPATVGAMTVAVSAGGAPVAGQLSVQRERVTFTPAGRLPAAAPVEVNIGASLADAAGNPLAAAARVSFTTADDQAPDPPLLDALPPLVNRQELAVAGAAEPRSRVAVRGGLASGTSPADGAGRFAATVRLAPNTLNVLEATASDAEGNTSAAATAHVVHDGVPPELAAASFDGQRTVTATFSEPLDPATVSASTVLLADAAGALAPALSVSGSGQTVLAELGGEPQPPLELLLSTDLADRAGNRLAVEQRRRFAAADGATFVVGEVFDDATTWPVAGATVTLVASNGLPTGADAPRVTTDGRGRFELPVQGSPVSVRIEADGFLPAWRTVTPEPGLANLLFDARLAPASAATLAIAAGGGSVADPSGVALAADGAATGGAPLEVRLSSVSGQGLPDLLPPGWRPLGAAALEVTAGTLAAVASLAIPVGTPPAPTAWVARYDGGARAWIAVAGASAYADNRVAAPAREPGIYAVVEPDPAPLGPGPAVASLPLPGGAPPDLAAVLAATLDIAPREVLPSQRAAATMTVTADRELPSGTPIHASLDERLTLVGGRQLVAPPLDCDLVLYRSGDRLVASFSLAPSPEAARVALEVGRKRVAVLPFPAGVRTADLVGPGGGTVVGADGTALTLPAGALGAVASVAVRRVGVEGISVPLPAGLALLAALDVRLGGATLALPAELSLPDPDPTATQVLALTPILADGATRWRLLGVARRDGGRLVIAADTVPSVPLPSVRGEGLVVLARAEPPWGLIPGRVLGAGGVGEANALVVAATGEPDPLLAPSLDDLVQLPQPDGSFGLAAPAGQVTVAALQLATRDVGQAQASVAAGQVAPPVTVTLLPTPPRVVATSPAAGATGVAPATPVTVDFSEPLDPARIPVAGALVVTVQPGGPWAGRTELSRDGRRITFTPARSFPQGSAVGVTVSADLRDLAGYPLAGGGYTFAFTIERVILPADLRTDRLRLYAPCAGGECPANPHAAALVRALPGALPAGASCFVEDLTRQAPVTTVAAGLDGSLELVLDAAVLLGDELLLHVGVGGPSEVTVPLRPWLAADGRGALVGSGGGRVVTADGIVVEVPEGALAGAETLRVDSLDPQAAVEGAIVPDWVEPVAALRLAGGANPAAALGLSLPAPATLASEFPLLLGLEVSFGGLRGYMVLDTARLEPDPDDPARRRIVASGGALDGGAAQAAVGGVRAAGVRAAEIDPNNRLPGIVSWGTLVALVPTAEVGWIIGTLPMPGLAAVADAGFLWVTNLRPEEPFRLPVRRYDSYVLRLIGPTGYVTFERSYDAPEIPFLILPGVVGGDGRPPDLIAGGPFRVHSFTAAAGTTHLDTGVVAQFSGGSSPRLRVFIDPGLVPDGAQAELTNLSQGIADAAAAEAGAAVELSVAAASGDRLVLAVEGRGVALATPLRLVFSEPVAGFASAKPVGASATAGAHAPTDEWRKVDATTWEFLPTDGWHADTGYLLTLPDSVSDLESPPRQLGHNLRLRFATAGVHAAPALPTGAVSGSARSGNLLLVAAPDQGVVAWDISDLARPARLTTYAMTGTPARDVALDGWGLVAAIGGTVDGQDVLALLRLSDLLQPLGTLGEALDREPLTPLEEPGGIPTSVVCEVRERLDAVTTSSPGPLRIERDAGGSVTRVVLPAAAQTPLHPVRLEDGLTGATLWQAQAGESPVDLEIPLAVWPRQPGWPLRVRRHEETLIHAAVGGGPLSSWAARPRAGDRWELVRLSSATIDPRRDPQAGCTGNADDLVYNARLGLLPARFDGAGKLLRPPLVLDMTLRHGVLPLDLEQDGESWELGMHVLGGVCVQTEGYGTRLTDMAVAPDWRVTDTGVEQRADLVALLSGDYLATLLLSPRGDWTWAGAIRLPSVGARLGLDPERRLALVADAAGTLYVVDLGRLYGNPPESGSDPRVVARVEIGGGGNADLLVDPGIGLALAGQGSGGIVPIAYAPPPIEVITDADGDGVLERASVLQALGAPRAPADAEGRRPAALAWLLARVPGGGERVSARFEARHAAGGWLGEHPPGLAPTAGEIDLQRVAGAAADPAASAYLSRSFVLIADERARAGVWLDPALGADEKALCRGCDRAALYGIPWRPEPGDEPLELAAGDEVRFVLEPTGGLASFGAEELERVAASVRSTRWEVSPPARRPVRGNASAPALPEIDLAAGTVELIGEDLALAAPGQGLSVTRAFTSGGVIVSPLGPGWDLAWRWRLRENLDGSVDLFDGNGRRFAFALANGAYVVPDDLFVRLVRTDTGFELRLTNGELAVFDRAGLLVELRDRFRNAARNGSALRFAYTSGGVPVRVTAVGAATAEDRFIAFALDRDGRITAAEDGTGRSVSYDYDPAGRLVAAAGVNLTCGVTTPGRPTWQYAYAEPPPPAADGLLTGAGVARLAQATDVADPEGRTALQADWDDAGRPRQVRRGELVWDVYYRDAAEAQVTDGAGSRTAVRWDDRGRLARLTEGEGTREQQVTTIVRNAAGLPTEVTLPSGAIIRNRYDSDNPDPTARGNLEREERAPDTAGGSNDGPRVTTWSYQSGTNLVTATSLPGSRTWRVNRDALGSPTSVVDPEGRTTLIANDAYGRVSSRTWGGATTRYRYDDSSSGELTRVEQPHEDGPAVTVIERDARGHPDAIVDPARQRTELSANELGWVFEETVGRGERQRSVAYLLNGDLARETAAAGAGSLAGEVVRAVEYSGAGLPVGVTTSGDGTSAISLERDGAGRLTGVRSSTGRGASYELDGLGRVTGVVVPDAGRSEISYDADDNVTSILSAAGRREIRDYNGFGEPVAITDPLGTVRRLERDGAGRVTGAAVVAGGREWQRLGWSYNRADQVVESRVHRFALDGSGGGDVLSTTLAYDGARGLLESVTDPLGNRTALAWDEAGRERTRTLADGTVLETRYHPTGLPRAVTERPGTALPGSPAEFTSLLEYNTAGDLVRHTDPGGNVTTIERGRLGEPAAVIYPGGRLERADASPLGRTVVRAASGRTAVTETSDPDGFLQQVAEQGGSTFAYARDLAGRLTSLTQPWGGTRRYAWDADGLLAGQTLEDGTAISDERDAAGRLVARNVVAGSATTGPARTIYVWDPAGRLAATDTGEARTTFTRDSTGAIVAETLAVGGREHTVRRTFDRAGRRVALSYPDGTVVHEGRDGLGRLTSLAGCAGCTDPAQAEPLWQGGYHGVRPGARTLPSGLALTPSYTAAGLLGGLAGTAADGAGVLSFADTFGAGSAIHRRAAREASVGLAWSDRVEHDPALRAAGFGQAGPPLPGVPGLASRWGVSSVGSSRRWAGRLSEGDDLLGRTLVEGGQLEVSTFTIDPASHQVQQGAGVAYAYDARGQRTSSTWLASGSQTDYRYDADGRLVEAGGREFIYDGLGRRVGSRTAAGLEVLVPDGDHAVATYRPDGTLARRSLFGDRIDEVIADQADLDSSHDGVPDTTLYPVQDAQGTLLGLVDRDGRVVESYLMDASGRARIYGRDESRPEVVMVRYRVAQEAGAEDPAWIEVTLSEAVRGQGTGDSGPESGGVTFVLEDSSGNSIATTLDASRADEGVLVFGLASTLTIGSYAIELSGVEDVAGNVVEAFAATGSVADPMEDAVLANGSRAGDVLAILDGPDGIAILTNVPIDPASITGAMTVKKQGEVVAGTADLLSETVALWTPEASAAWIEGASYEVTLAAGLLDVAGRPITVQTGSLSFTHLAQGDAIWTRPAEAPLRQQSAYGNDRFLHGRPYLADLGLSDHRARFYDLDTQAFLSPDPLGPLDSPSAYQAFSLDATSITDPTGRWGADFHWYVTYYVASLVMSDEERVEHIAWASRRVDKHESTQPFTPLSWSLRFHFPDQGGQGTEAGVSNTLLATISQELPQRGDFFLGIALHLLADSFSHAGYTWRNDRTVNSLNPQPPYQYLPIAEGHVPAGTAPDNPKVWFDRAAAAAVACYELTYDYASARGIAKARYDVDELRGAFERLFMALPEERSSWAPALRAAFRSWGVDAPHASPGLNWLHEDDYAEYARAQREIGEIMSAGVAEQNRLRDRAARERFVRRVMSPLAVWTARGGWPLR